MSNLIIGKEDYRKIIGSGWKGVGRGHERGKEDYRKWLEGCRTGSWTGSLLNYICANLDHAGPRLYLLRNKQVSCVRLTLV
jgi:hypothetical protein